MKGRLHSMSLSSVVLTFCITVSLTVAGAGQIEADEPQIMLLWADGAPDALGDADRDKPKLIAYLPKKEKSTGCAVVICPGGGYGHLAMDHEGKQIGEWLNSIGVAGFICDYRHRGKDYGHPAPLQDAQRAIRMVRAMANEFNIDPQRVGVLGFSAGGHLASTTATHFDDGDKTVDDRISRQSSRPDFAILCYPVIAFGEDYTHSGSQRNLLGENASPELIRQFSNEKQVTKNTPPTFLWHTSDDGVVSVENSIQFFRALRKAEVPAELHVFETGRHGLGLAQTVPSVSNWPKQCENWMRARGLLDKSSNENE